MLRREQLGVSRALDGRVQVRLGGQHFLLAPDEAVRFATAVLEQAGVDCVMADPGQVVVVPRRGLVS